MNLCIQVHIDKRLSAKTVVEVVISLFFKKILLMIYNYFNMLFLKI